jgi:hypothetical protein
MLLTWHSPAPSVRDLPAGLEANDEVLLLPLRRSEVAEFNSILVRLDWD